MTRVLTLALLGLAAQAVTPAQPPMNDLDFDALAIQVALDRAGFSPGVIDGRIGAITKRAAEAYRAQNGHDPEPFPDALIEYRITAEDTAGPFAERIPSDLMAQSKLPALSYRSVDEAIAERFHTTPQVLRRLNALATFTADEAILVPNVEPLVIPSAPEQSAQGSVGQPPATGTDAQADNDRNAVVVRVSRASSSLTVTGPDGRILFFAPVTTGSINDPLPLGEWKVNGVQHNPTFRYNPDLFWDADPAHTKATIPAGPNGPVGLVWIDISKEHYGLHGSPEPSQIGRTQSHGCVRLTNWDALRLAGLVRPGTKVLFTP
jgi:lipoprotein-anchoring transpeptidase ErfK/SrfK